MEKEWNPRGTQVQWQSRCWQPWGESQEASSIRHCPLGQVLWDTPHLQADLGNPAMSQCSVFSFDGVGAKTYQGIVKCPCLQDRAGIWPWPLVGSSHTTGTWNQKGMAKTQPRDLGSLQAGGFLRWNCSVGFGLAENGVQRGTANNQR